MSIDYPQRCQPLGTYEYACVPRRACLHVRTVCVHASALRYLRIELLPAATNVCAWCHLRIPEVLQTY